MTKPLLAIAFALATFTQSVFAQEPVSLERLPGLITQESTLDQRFEKHLHQLADPKTGEIGAYQLSCVDRARGDLASVLVETGFDRSTEAARRAGAKGYVNGCISSWTRAGLKLHRIFPKQLDSQDLSKPLNVQIVLARPDGTNVFIHKRILFTNRGYDITVMSTDRDRVAEMQLWAEGVKPAPIKVARSGG